MKTEKIITERLSLIQDPSSPYYCGSAIYLRLLPLIKRRKEEIKEKDSCYPEEEKSLLFLFDKDPIIFEESKKKDGEKINWDRVTSFFQEQAVFFDEFRNRIESVPFQTRSEERNSLLVSCFDTLAEEARENLSVFFDFEESTDEFKQAGVSVLREIEGRVVPYPPRKKIQLTKDQEEGRKLSSLVPSSLLRKLINRKQKGKKPFSSEFDAEKKRKAIQNCLSSRMNKSACMKVSEISRFAAKEISNPGFKIDFDFIASALENLSKIVLE